MFLNSLEVSKSQSISRIRNLSAKAPYFQGPPSQYMTTERQEDVLDTIFHSSPSQWHPIISHMFFVVVVVVVLLSFQWVLHAIAYLKYLFKIAVSGFQSYSFPYTYILKPDILLGIFLKPRMKCFISLFWFWASP